MSDILERLRSPATVFYEYSADDGALLREAADEISNLRAERDRWREAAQAATPGGSEFCDPRAVREFIEKQRRELVQAKMENVRLTRLRADLEKAKAALLRARLDAQGVAGFVYTGPTDDHMRKADAFLVAMIERLRTTLAELDRES